MVQSKLLRAFGILSKLRYIFPLNILKRFYFAFQHPHLLYSLIIWGATFKSYLQPIAKLKTEPCE